MLSIMRMRMHNFNFCNSTQMSEEASVLIQLQMHDFIPSFVKPKSLAEPSKPFNHKPEGLKGYSVILRVNKINSG